MVGRISTEAIDGLETGGSKHVGNRDQALAESLRVMCTQSPSHPVTQSLTTTKPCLPCYHHFQWTGFCLPCEALRGCHLSSPQNLRQRPSRLHDNRLCQAWKLTLTRKFKVVAGEPKKREMEGEKTPRVCTGMTSWLMQDSIRGIRVHARCTPTLPPNERRLQGCARSRTNYHLRSYAGSGRIWGTGPFSPLSSVPVPFDSTSYVY